MAGKARIGAELFCAADLRQALDAARQDGLDFACSPLSHPRNARDARGVSERREAPETRSDLALTCGEGELWSCAGACASSCCVLLYKACVAKHEHVFESTAVQAHCLHG